MRVRKFEAPILRKFVNTSLEIMQLMRKVGNRVEKARNCPNVCRYQRAHLELFWGEGQQSSHGTGGGAWAKITNAKGGTGDCKS